MTIKLNYRVIAIVLSAVLLLCLVFSRIFADEKPAEGISLPIIMYHHISDDPRALNDYVISPKELESDFRYLKEKGYTAILPKDLTDYVNSGTPLPENPVMITFDDGFESVYHYAYPLARKYKMKFLLAVFGKETEHFSKINDHNILYSYITWEEIKELANSGLCEIANHTYNLHKISDRKGVKIKNGENAENYESILLNDVTNLQNLIKENSGIEPKTFVYPYGFYCEESEKILKASGFSVTLTCNEGINIITKNPDSLYLLKRYNRPSGLTSDNFFDSRL